MTKKQVKGFLNDWKQHANDPPPPPEGRKEPGLWDNMPNSLRNINV